MLREAISALTADNAPALAELTARLAVSERQLRNLFTAGIGLSPKQFARIQRLHRVLAVAGNPRGHTWPRTPATTTDPTSPPTSAP
ncbi:hypothetical protein ACFYO7_19405 [Nocardia salmonicida]|uniref:hypothetical protein n=1 Tax=Nocardia salmonicida TaxID=53431 RepID=UPI003687318B